MGYKIAIDGPAGAGKGYVAREISNILNILYIDTGAMYRAFGVYVNENKVNLEDIKQVENALSNCDIYFKNINDEIRIFINNDDVSEKIRSEQAGLMASKVSAINIVRQDMVKRQKELAKKDNVIMEGRDIGSVVLKDAELKIYLTADIQTRAERRLKDLIIKDKTITLDKVISDITTRDFLDTTKKISPLIKTKDAIEVDTTTMSKEEVVKYILNIIKDKGLLN